MGEGREGGRRGRTDGLGVLVRLVLGGSSRVLSVVGELVSESVSGDRVAAVELELAAATK